LKEGKIRIAIIGGGETGTPLLRQLVDADFVEVVGVADLQETAPGVVLAREKGIATTTDFMELAYKGEEIDIMIDVTGVPEVRERLRTYMQESGNNHTIIMHEMIAILMMSLSQGKLVAMKHGEVEYN
jgi:predicted homoserine dehydrogenase-like protein